MSMSLNKQVHQVDLNVGGHRIYWLGGSPCAGKSSVADLLAERYGLTPGHVRRATTTLLRGTKVGEVYEAQKRFDVMVWGESACRASLKPGSLPCYYGKDIVTNKTPVDVTQYIK